LCQLDLDNDSEHRLAIDKQHNQICSVFSRHDVSEVSGFDPDGRIVRKCYAQGFSQQRRRKFGAILKKHP